VLYRNYDQLRRAPDKNSLQLTVTPGFVKLCPLGRRRSSIKTRNAFRQPFAIDRLQEVVECMYLKSPYRVVFESSGKHDCRPLGRRDGIQNAESAQTGHLDIQKNNIGRKVFDRFDGCQSICGFPDDLDLIFMFSEQAMQFLQSLRFVVDDNRASSHARTSENSGNVNVTRVPAGSRAESRSLAWSR